MPDLLTNAPAMRKWADELAAIHDEQRRVSSAIAEDVRRRNQARSDYKAAVRAAIANGDPLPDEPSDAPNETLEQLSADLDRRRILHREQREAAVRDSAAHVEAEALANWRRLRERWAPHIDELRATLAGLNADLADLAEVRRAAEPSIRSGGRADRTLSDVSLDDFAHYVAHNVPMTSLTPPPRPIQREDDVDEVHAGHRVRRPMTSFH